MSTLVKYRNIWNVSYPIILGSIAQNIVNVTDTAFLGRVNHIALGAAGNAGIFYFVLMVVGLGFSIGCQIIIGRRNGAEDYKSIGDLFYHGLVFLIPMAILLFLFVQFVSPIFLEALTASKEILKAANEFLQYRSFGILFAFINYNFIALYTGITKTKVLTYATVTQATVNVILDYALIFGEFGLPELGIRGAAIASVISEFTALIFFISYTRYQVDYKKYQLHRFVKIYSSKLKKIISVSTPVMFQNFLAIGSWLAFFMIIEQMGEKELAVSHIARSIYMVLMIPLFGFSSATSTLVANLIGEGGSHLVRLLVKRIMILCLAATCSLLPIVIIFPRKVSSIYTHDLALIEASVPLFYLISATMFFFSVAYISFSAVTGTGKTKISLSIEFISISAYLIGAYLIANHFQLSLPYVWCCELIYFAIMGGLASLYLKFGNWRKLKI